MKKTSKILLALLTVTLVLCLVSCNSDAFGNTSATTENTTEGTTDSTTTECTHDNMRTYGEESTCLVGGWFTEECYECGYSMHADFSPLPFTSVIKEKLSDTRFVLTVDEKYREELGETVFINVETYQSNSELLQSFNVGTALKVTIGSYSGHDTIGVEPMEIFTSEFSAVELPSEIRVMSGDQIIEPLACVVGQEIYISEQGGWLNACGGGAYMVFDDLRSGETEIEIPVLIMKDGVSVSISSNGTLRWVNVYDTEYESVELNNDTLEGLKELPSGEWYVAAFVVWQGDYIEKDDSYESSSYDYLFKLIVE